MVLIGGGVAGCGYILTSWLASALTPHYSWRILWLIGLPTGVLFIALNHWIPESPRFLIAAGRRDEAEKIMNHFGAAIVTGEEDQATEEQRAGGSWRQLFGGPFTGPSIAVVVLAVGAGLVTYGFQLWIPTNLEHLGFTTVNSDYIVRNAALIGLPFSLVATVLYGFWSSKKTVVASFGLLALALIGFAIAGNSLARNHAVLTALLAIPLVGTSLVAAIVTVHASEVYPTQVRSRGTGLAAGATKAGGVLIIALVVAATTTPSIAMTALIGVIPLVAGIAIFAWVGYETRSRRLEDISRVEMPLADSRNLRSAGGAEAGDEPRVGILVGDYRDDVQDSLFGVAG